MIRKLLCCFFLIGFFPIVMAQVKVSGTVQDDEKNPLAGVAVLVKGTTKGVSTDLDGKYSIDAKQGDVLEFSFIGFKTQLKKVSGNGNSLTINVLLQEDAQELGDVVVTAFGASQKKTSIVGSVQTVKVDDLKIPANNLSNSFAGRMAGVISYQRGGAPGSDTSDFFIRGISTISGATSPLIIVDGVQVSAYDLNAIDPEVIESFSILKDATATALYGSRGANGVMVVTTKSGADLDKTVIGVRVEANMAMPTSIPKFTDAVNYMNLYNEAVDNLSSGAGKYSLTKIDGTARNLNPYIFPNVDWYNELFNEYTFNQKANVNVRGGGKKVDYFINVLGTNETGVIKGLSKDYFSFDNNINVKRYVFQNNINAKLGNTSRLSLRLNAQMRDVKQPNMDVNNLFGYVMNSNPVDFPIRFPEDGITPYVKWGAFTDTSYSAAVFNPIAALVSSYREVFESTVIANLEFKQDLNFLTQGLKFSALASFKNWSQTATYRSANYNKYSINSYVDNGDGTYSFTPTLYGNEVVVNLNTTSGYGGDRRIYLQSSLEYDRTFNGVHTINAMAIYNQDALNNNLASGDASLDRLISSLPRRKQGIAGRLSYAYDNKYLVEVNAGYNGSENFAEGKRWGFFPSVALGYNVSNSKLFEPLKPIIQNLKVRTSWGLVGNDETGAGRFIYMESINLNGRGYTTGIDQNYGLNGPNYTRYKNEDLTWEVGEKINLGIDMQLLNSLTINFDAFREHRKNIFQARGTIPTYLGTAGTAVYSNSAEVLNKGFDIGIDFGKKLNDNLSVYLKGTFTYAHNEILKYDEPLVQDYPNLKNVGRSLYVNSGYIAEGLFIDQAEINNRPTQKISSNVAPGDIKYADIPNRLGVTDGQIDSNDRVAMGYPTVPEIVYGFGPSVFYKKWDFNCFFQGVANTSLMMSGFHPFGTSGRRNVLSWIADSHWSPTNQDINAAYPRLTKDDHENNTTASSFWLRDASFLKLKTAEIGYRYKKMRFYVNGSNLLTFAKFKHWDPEQGGGNGFKYPTQRVYNIGFQMTIN